MTLILVYAKSGEGSQALPQERKADHVPARSIGDRSEI
jgi:hypothetical protein